MQAYITFGTEYLNYCLNQTDFSPVINKANPDSAHNTFIKLYEYAYNTAFPKTKICVNKRYIKRTNE